MNEHAEMLSVEDALIRVTGGFSPIASEQVALSEGLGRVLAKDVAARLTQPPVAVSAMDGYAVRGADVATAPVTLERIGESQAGSGFSGTVAAGQCTRIFTGAPLPEGTDTIIIQEVTEVDGDAVTIKEAAPTGDFVRPAGLDFSEGEVLLRAGQTLTARDIGLAAAMNVPWVRVRRRPLVAFVATGDELVMPGDPLGPDQIVSSNSLGLAAMIRVLGGEPLDLGIARDTEDSLKDVLAGARGADCLVTIGGASVGDYDLVRRVMGEEGLELTFYKVAMRPGKPLIFGHWNAIPVLGLPGNPVSAGVTALIFLKAAMAIMLGTGDGSLETAPAVLGCDMPAGGRRRDFLRAQLDVGVDGRLTASPFDAQDSAMMARFAEARCLVIRPAGAEPMKAGDAVEIIRLDAGLRGF